MPVAGSLGGYESIEELSILVERDRGSCPGEMELYSRDRWIRIMCDYDCEGVWAKDGGAISPQMLPISIALIDRILRWQERYEALNDWDSGAQPVPETELRNFSDEGLAIAIEVKLELPDWTVVYFDEYRAEVSYDLRQRQSREAPPREPNEPEDAYRRRLISWSSPTQGERMFFEYEVTADVLATGRPPADPRDRRQASFGEEPC